MLGPTYPADRFESQQNGPTHPLVGRDRELDLLRRRWEQARAGRAQVVLIGGEPGIGKSRLAVMLQERVDRKSVV